MLLVVRQEGHPACSLSLASVKSRLVLPFWYRLTWVVLEKGPVNGCVCGVCGYTYYPPSGCNKSCNGTRFTLRSFQDKGY